MNPRKEEDSKTATDDCWDADLDGEGPGRREGAGREVTADLRAGERGEERVRLQAAALEAAANSIVITNRDGKILWVNPAFTILTGYAAEEAVGQNPRLLKSGQQPNSFYEEMWKTVLAGRIWHGEIINRRKDGSLYTEEMTITPVRDHRGEITHFIAIKQDVTARKEAEEALRHSEEKFARAFRSSPDSISITTLAEGRYLEVNDIFLSITGYRREEVIGHTADELRIWAQPADRTMLFSRLQQQGRARDLELRFRMKSGEIRWGLLSGEMIELAGQPCLLAIVRDITGGKHTEEELTARARQQAAVAELGQQALAGIELSALMQEAVTLIARTLDVEYCKVLELLPSGKALLLRAGVGWKEGLVGQATVGAGTDSQAGYTLLSDEPVIVENLRAETRFSGPPLLHEHGVVSGMSVIIRGQDRSFGVLGAHTRKKRKFTQDDVHFLQAVANVLATSIGQKRAEAERQVIGEIVQGASLTGNLDELLRLIHESLRKVVYAENCFVALYDRNTGMFEFPFFVDQFDTVPPPQKLEKSCTAYVFRTGKPLLLKGDTFQQLIARDEVELVGTDSPSWLGVPLQTPSETIGVLVVQHYQDESAYSERDLEFLASVGSQIALAIERKRADEHIRLLAKAVETSTDLICVTDAEGHLKYANKALLQAYGYTEDEILGKHFSILRSRNNAPDLVAQVWEETRRGGWQGELLNRKRDGSEFPIWLSTGHIKDKEGRLIGYLGSARDISDRKRLEQQLRQAQKMEAVGRLAGGVAHDFNNLLMVVKGYSELMVERLKLSDPLRRNAQEILNAANRAASLTRQLLAFSRKQVLEPSVLDLNAIVAEADKMLRRLIGEDIELVTVLDSTLGRVKADPGQIEQVIVNLAVNARDAMPRGGKLTIETANAELDASYAQAHVSVVPGSYAMIAVSDSGMGMDAATLAHIFEPFFTTKTQGTGLGLATVYGIVKQSGGYIWAYSELGQGTTFKIYLPLVEQPIEVSKPGKVPARPAPGTETVLLVEDEESVRELVSLILTGKGYAVLEARDGDHAVELSRRHKGPIDLLVTDVVMPGMSGRALAERLALFRPQMKVLYMSGYTDDAIVHHGVLEPGVAFLQKPFTPDTLARKVREVLDGNQKHA